MDETYQSGRRLAKKTEVHKSGKTKSEGTYLFARQVLKSNYDWWNGTIATTSSTEGKDQRHGAFTSWHPNGQKNEEGHYQNDLPVGKFTWWYSNGQLSSEGNFDSGDRDGAWTWWHENGLKAVSGEFVKGVEIGKWTWWNEDGKVANSARITQGQSKTIVEQTAVPAQPTIVAAPTPTPPSPKNPVRPARTSRKPQAATTRR
jgi:antitoxin component YwqK of YwqJK toxin-antitoxin module